MFLKHLKTIIHIALVLGLTLSIMSCSILKKRKVEPQNLNTLIEQIIVRKLRFTPSADRALLVSVIQNNEIQTLRFPNDSSFYSVDLNIESRFLIGGLSKVFVIALLKRLEEEEALDLDETFNTIIPAKYINPRMQLLRLKDLINHHSGLPKLPNNIGSTYDGHPYSKYGKVDLLNFYSNFTPPENISFGYSHINYALIEIALETKYHLTLNQLLNKYLFANTNNTNSFIYTNQETTSTLYPGFKKNGIISKFKPFKSFGGALGMVTNMEELSKIVFEILISGNLNFNAIDMQYPAHVSHIKMQGGWYKLMEDNNQYLMHAGRSEGHYAFVSICKSQKKAVIILSNSAKGIDFIGVDIIRSICQ